MGESNGICEEKAGAFYAFSGSVIFMKIFCARKPTPKPIAMPARMPAKLALSGVEAMPQLALA